MNIPDFFEKVPAITTGEVRSFLRGRDPDEYNLVDVRQPGEYEEGHLPGARLIPLGKLEERIAELDPGKPTIAY